MTLRKQESLRDDLYKAIDKVLEDHTERGTFEDFWINASLTEMVTNSAMKQITDLDGYYSEAINDGIVNP